MPGTIYFYILKDSAGETIYINSSNQASVIVDFMAEGDYLLEVEGITNPCFSEFTIDYNLQPSGVEVSPDSFVLPCNETAALDILANDASAPASLEILSDPSNGSINFAGVFNIEYTPNNGYAGPDSFTYRLCDAGGCCAEAEVSITVEECPVPVNCLMDFFELGECDTETGRQTIDIYSLTPGQSVFYKLFKSDGELYAQNSTTTYPVEFKNVPWDTYTVTLINSTCTEEVEVEIGCDGTEVVDPPQEPEDPPIVDNPEFCAYNSHESSCFSDKARIDIYVNNLEGPALHKLFNAAGEQVRINSTTANPCVFKTLPPGTYELQITYDGCTDVISVDLFCD